MLPACLIGPSGCAEIVGERVLDWNPPTRVNGGSRCYLLNKRLVYCFLQRVSVWCGDFCSTVVWTRCEMFKSEGAAAKRLIDTMLKSTTSRINGESRWYSLNTRQLGHFTVKIRTLFGGFYTNIVCTLYVLFLFFSSLDLSYSSTGNDHTAQKAPVLVWSPKLRCAGRE